MSIGTAAREPNIAPSTLHRWVNEGYIAGGQETPVALWRIRVNDELRSRLVEKAPAGYVTLDAAAQLLGVSRQTILRPVKRGEVKAIHVFRGRAKGVHPPPAASPPA
jgi:excisionase family DNA binding protein